MCTFPLACSIYTQSYLYERTDNGLIMQATQCDLSYYSYKNVKITPVTFYYLQNKIT